MRVSKVRVSSKIELCSDYHCFVVRFTGSWRYVFDLQFRGRTFVDTSATHLFVAIATVVILGLEVSLLDRLLCIDISTVSQKLLDGICRGCHHTIEEWVVVLIFVVLDVTVYDVISGISWLSLVKWA